MKWFFEKTTEIKTNRKSISFCKTENIQLESPPVENITVKSLKNDLMEKAT